MPRRRALLFIAWLGWVFDVMDAALFNFAKGPMLAEMLGPGSHADVEGRIQAVFLVGWAVGGLVFGVLADRWGRARTLALTVALYSGLTGLTALCRTPDQVAVLRFLTGIGIGGEWAAGAALVAEAYRGGGRPLASAWLQSAAAFGPWLAATANLAVPPGNWRALFLIGVIPAGLTVAIRLFVREPEVLARPEAAPLRALFAPGLRRRTLVACALGIVGVTGAGLLPFWLPNLVAQAAGPAGEAAKARFTSLNTYTLHLGTLAGVFVFPWFAERVGRRGAFAVFFLGAPLAMGAALFGSPTLEGLLWRLPVAAFFSVGVSAGFVLYFPELFPSSVRATGSGLAYNAGRVVAAGAPAAVGAVIAGTGGNAAYGVLLGAAVYALGLAALPFAPETRGRGLPE